MEMNPSELYFNQLEYNLYELMNLSIDCSVEDVRKKFKKLIKRFHPDKITALEESLYYNITIAHHVLGNIDSKMKYDKWLLKSSIDHSELKNNFKEELTSVQQYFPKTQKDAQVEFMKASDELYQKHGGYMEDTRPISSIYKEKEIKRKNIPMIVKEDFDGMKDFNKRFVERKVNGIYCDKIVKRDTNIIPFSFSSPNYSELKDRNNIYLKDSTIDYAFSLINVNSIDYGEDDISPSKLTKKINDYNTSRNINNKLTLDDLGI